MRDYPDKMIPGVTVRTRLDEEGERLTESSLNFEGGNGELVNGGGWERRV